MQLLLKSISNRLISFFLSCFSYHLNMGLNRDLLTNRKEEPMPHDVQRREGMLDMSDMKKLKKCQDNLSLYLGQLINKKRKPVEKTGFPREYRWLELPEKYVAKRLNVSALFYSLVRPWVVWLLYVEKGLRS